MIIELLGPNRRLGGIMVGTRFKSQLGQEK